MTDGGHLAARVMPRLLRGKPVFTLGDPDAPHSWSYLPMWPGPWWRSRARNGPGDGPGTCRRSPRGPPVRWSAASPLSRERGRSRCAGCRRPCWVSRRSSPRLIRGLKEVRYQFERPFVVDASAYEAEFAVRATPVDEQVKATVDWWRERLATTG